MSCPCTPDKSELRQLLRYDSAGSKLLVTQRWNSARGAWVELSAQRVR